MPLQMQSSWRFKSPAPMPPRAAYAFNDLVQKIAAQSQSTWAVLELFKGKFGGPGRSSSESWAVSDLHDRMMGATDNAATFIAAFWDGCEQVQANEPLVAVPDATVINELLIAHEVPFELRPPNLLSRGLHSPVVMQPPHASIGEQATALIRKSLEEADRLLLEGRPRLAVQEILWLLETVSTGMRGVDTANGTIEGKYFNDIVKQLKHRNPGTTLAQILGWMTAMHGFLSSPTGGGVRHGTELKADVSPTPSEAQLYCNLIRSYVNFLLAEMVRGP